MFINDAFLADTEITYHADIESLIIFIYFRSTSSCEIMGGRVGVLVRRRAAGEKLPR